MTLPDRTIIAQSTQHLVLAERHQVQFTDLTTLDLHRVATTSGVDMMHVRAVRTDTGWAVFDLRDVVLTLRDWLKGVPERDVLGVVYYGLRFHFGTAGMCRSAAMDKSLEDIAQAPAVEGAAA